MSAGTDTTGHPDVSEISDLTEGLLPTARTTAVREHLAECEECTGVHAALEEIRGLLGRLPGADGTTPMPEDVVTRIDAALAAEASLSAALPDEDDSDSDSDSDDVSRETSVPDFPSARTPAPAPAGTSTSERPGRPLNRPSPSTGPGRKKRRLHGRSRSVVLGALLTVAVVGAGGLMFELVENSPTGSSSSSAADTSPSSTVDAFSKGELENQVADLLTSTQSPDANPENTDGGAANSPGAAEENPQTMIQPSVVVPDCIRMGLDREDDALGAAPGTYNGDDAYLVVLPDVSDNSRVVAYVVDATCVTDHTLTPGKVLLKQSYARP